MSMASKQDLIDLKPKMEFFVGIDSDGCAFPTMELKHKECFIPNIVRYFGLQSVSKYAREAGEFVNLYSKWRGINRFPALLMAIDLLRERPEVTASGVELPAPDDQGTVRSRSGTSYAVPYLVAQLSQSLHEGVLSRADWQGGRAVPVVDLGAAGRDPVFGWGLPRAPVRCG